MQNHSHSLFQSLCLTPTDQFLSKNKMFGSFSGAIDRIGELFSPRKSKTKEESEPKVESTDPQPHFQFEGADVENLEEMENMQFPLTGFEGTRPKRVLTEEEKVARRKAKQLRTEKHSDISTPKFSKPLRRPLVHSRDNSGNVPAHKNETTDQSIVNRKRRMSNAAQADQKKRKVSVDDAETLSASRRTDSKKTTDKISVSKEKCEAARRRQYQRLHQQKSFLESKYFEYAADQPPAKVVGSESEMKKDTKNDSKAPYDSSTTDSRSLPKHEEKSSSEPSQDSPNQQKQAKSSQSSAACSTSSTQTSTPRQTPRKPRTGSTTPLRRSTRKAARKAQDSIKKQAAPKSGSTTRTQQQQVHDMDARMEKRTSEYRKQQAEETQRKTTRQDLSASIAPQIQRRARRCRGSPVGILREFFPECELASHPTKKEVQKAFRKALAKFHPDSHRRSASESQRVESEEIYKLLNEIREKVM